MNLRALDLNLLVILHALLDERHVTRAARRLALSQPATSNALDRCRHLFNDPLLERVAGEMRLTPKAEALRAPLLAALNAVSAVIDAPSASLADKQQAVYLIMADQPGMTVLTRALPRLREVAPKVDLVLLPWRGSEDALHRLENGEADLAVSVFPNLQSPFHHVDVMHEQYVVVMRAQHPVAKRFDLDAWLAFPHVLVSGLGEKRGWIDDLLDIHGHARRVGAVVPNFMMVEPLLQESDMMALLPRFCLPLPPRVNLAVFAPPLDISGFSLQLAWHARRANDPVTQYVGGMVKDVLSSLNSQYEQSPLT